LVLGAIHLGVLSAMRRSGSGQPEGRGAMLAMAVAGVVGIGGLVPLSFHLGQGEADTRMALHAIASGRDDEARAWLARAGTRHPTPGVAWLRAGLAWQARNDFPAAERALREAHRLDPEVADVSFALAEVLITEGKGGEAAPLLEQAERAGVRPDRVRLDLALAYWQAGDQARAREVLARGVPTDGLPLLRARALASVEARRVDLAEWLLTEHRRYVPGDAEVAEKLGLMKGRGGDGRAAAALFEEAARLDPGRATARFNLAIAYLQQGRRDEAIAQLREALRIDPTYAQAAGALRELLAGSSPGDR
jgi:Flp pilus assembly protein TadD